MQACVGEKCKKGGPTGPAFVQIQLSIRRQLPVALSMLTETPGPIVEDRDTLRM